MSRRGHSVVFAALLLVSQLLFGVMSSGSMAQDVTQPCDGCPGGATSSLAHGIGSHAALPGSDHTGAHCGTHCSHDGSPDSGNSGCNSGCAMAGSGHCGTHASPAFMATGSTELAVMLDSFEGDRRPVDLPDSPLFDFLRPPTRA